MFILSRVCNSCSPFPNRPSKGSWEFDSPTVMSLVAHLRPTTLLGVEPELYKTSLKNDCECVHYYELFSHMNDG